MLDQSALGQRVVVRVRRDRPAGGPGLSDVTGVLLSLDDQTAVLRGRSGLIRLAVADIAVTRVVAPATRDILSLQRVAALGWRAAEVDELDGWLLRADHGCTRRANSALPLTGATRALPLLLAELTAWYRARDLPPLIQIPLPARQLLDAELERLGWRAEGHSIVLTRPIPLETPAGPATPPVTLAPPGPSLQWLARQADRSEVARALLGRHPAAVFASVVPETTAAVQPVAVARGAVDEGWLGISALTVMPEHRRRGLASALVAALGQWAQDEHGARHCYLQVEADNSAALELYRRRGFTPHHRYHYRRAPVG